MQSSDCKLYPHRGWNDVSIVFVSDPKCFNSPTAFFQSLWTSTDAHSFIVTFALHWQLYVVNNVFLATKFQMIHTLNFHKIFSSISWQPQSMLSMKPSVLRLFFALLLLLFFILSCIMQHWFYMSSFQLEAALCNLDHAFSPRAEPSPLYRLT